MNKLVSSLLLAALGPAIVAAAACGGGTPPPAATPDPAATAAPSETATSTATTAATAAEAPSAPATTTTAAASATVPAPLASVAAEFTKMLEEAKKNEVGATPCEKSFNAMTAMVKAMQEASAKAAKEGAKVKTSGKIPTKDKFMKACGKQTPEVQQCMLTSYALEHQDECKGVMTPEVRKKLQDDLKK
jgi:hypothetical protein